MTKAFVLTAGMGTRLRPLTLKQPKPAISVNKVPLVYHTLFLLKSNGINDFVFNLHYLPGLMKDSLDKLKADEDNFFYSHEVEEILGGAGGLRHAWEEFSQCDDILYCNGDEIFLPKREDVIIQLIEKRRKTNALATLLTLDYPGVGTKFGGVWINQDSRVLGFGKDAPNDNSNALHFTGYMALSPEIIDHIPKTGAANILYGVLDKAIKDEKHVNTLQAEGRWFEVGNPDDLLLAQKELVNLAGKKDPYYLRLKNSISL